MGSIGAPELIVIALIAILLFGASRIADIGKGLGQGIKNFKQGLKEANEVDNDDDDQKSAKKSEKAEKAEKSEKAKKEEAAEEA